MLPLHAAWWEEDGRRHYLLDEYDIAYTPSLQVLKMRLDRAERFPGPARRLFAVQNPDGSLPNSDREVEAVSRLFPAEAQHILPGRKATLAAVKAQVHLGEEILFSCHGVFDLAQSEHSRLALAPPDQLPLADIVSWHLPRCWLTVLSACETGLTDFRDLIDDYQGLAAAFLAAGSQTVAASLWAVSDFSTALLMQRFHENLYQENPVSGEHRNIDKATALCEAQRWLRDLTVAEFHDLKVAKSAKPGESKTADKGDPAALSPMPRMTPEDETDTPSDPYGLPPDAKLFAHPYWWAAFQCVGVGWASR